jgi:DDE superfamily endonuclease
LIDQSLRILYLSPTYPGSVHDKRIADEHPYDLPKDSLLWQDLGFLAYEIDRGTTRTPHKKPRGRSLTEAQKAENRANSSIRVRIEHVNAPMVESGTHSTESGKNTGVAGTDG